MTLGTSDASASAMAATSHIKTGDTAPAAMAALSPYKPPLLLSIPEARRQFGGIGTTAFYEAVKNHNIKLVKIGARSLVPMTEVERVVAEIIAAADDRAAARAKAVELAEKSVAARRARRGRP